MVDKSKLKISSDKNLSKEKVERVSAEKIAKDDEPSWYHYVIVLIVFGLVIYGGYYGFNYIDSTYAKPINIVPEDDFGLNGSLVLTKYPYKVGNVTYNIYFHDEVDNIALYDFVVEPSKIDILNTAEFILSFDVYNGTDNGEVTKASTKFVSFVKMVYRFEFDLESFVMHNESSCSTSSLKYKVVEFDPNSNETGVFFDEKTGCVKFLAENPKDMVKLSDKFIYDMIFEN